MKVDREVQELINQVRGAGWSASFNSNKSRVIFRSPTGKIITCPTVCKPNLLRGIIRDLAKNGLDIGAGIVPTTSVMAAWEEALARRERKLTPQECGEDREPAEVIVRHPKGSGSGKTGNHAPVASTTVTTTTTTTTGGEVPRIPPQYTSIKDAAAAGVQLSTEMLELFTNDLTCRICDITIATVGGCGPHIAMHRRKGTLNVDINKALEILTDYVTKPQDDTADLKRRLKMVRDALDKPLMKMMTDINTALEGIDL